MLGNQSETPPPQKKDFLFKQSKPFLIPNAYSSNLTVNARNVSHANYIKHYFLWVEEKVFSQYNNMCCCCPVCYNCQQQQKESKNIHGLQKLFFSQWRLPSLIPANKLCSNNKVLPFFSLPFCNFLPIISFFIWNVLKYTTSPSNKKYGSTLPTN